MSFLKLREAEAIVRKLERLQRMFIEHHGKPSTKIMDNLKVYRFNVVFLRRQIVDTLQRRKRVCIQ